MLDMKVRIAVVLILLTGAAAFSSQKLYQSRSAQGQMTAGELPMLIGGWVGTPGRVTEYEKAILETDDIVKRSYENPRFRHPVQMAVVYSPDNRRVAHPPDLCYEGEGWEVIDKQIVTLEGIPPMVQLTLAKGADSRDIVLYCFMAGEQITAQYLQQQYNIMKNFVMGKATSSALLRFSTHVGDNETPELARQRVVEFLHHMMPEIETRLN